MRLLFVRRGFRLLRQAGAIGQKRLAACEPEGMPSRGMDNKRAAVEADIVAAAIRVHEEIAAIDLAVDPRFVLKTAASKAGCKFRIG